MMCLGVQAMWKAASKIEPGFPNKVAKPSLLICILRKHQPEITKEVKRFGDILEGIVTQVVVGEKLKAKGLNQYWYCGLPLNRCSHLKVCSQQ